MKNDTKSTIFILVILAITWMLVHDSKVRTEAFRQRHYDSLSASEKELVDFALTTQTY